ncbi:MAG: dienelactone hydrolase family protein [bacterium]
MTNNKNEQRKLLYSLLGHTPDRFRPISVKQVSETEKETYILEKLVLDLNGMELVPAYFVRPKNSIQKLPTILYNHSHGGNYTLGKNELLLGNDYLSTPPYAEELTRHGYAVLCIDSWAFGERSTRPESIIFKHMLWFGQVLWGMMVYDSIRAIDYLLTRSDVDANRIGTLGMSMGSTMAWWIAALDTRIKVCLDICCLTDSQTLIKVNGLDLHGLYYYVPGLLKYFSTAQINALIAPRPHLSLVGELDPLTPQVGVDIIDEELQKVYNVEGADTNWKLVRSNTAHIETPAMRQEIIDWLSRFL